MTIEHLAAQDCADRANEEAKALGGNINWSPDDFTLGKYSCGKAYLADRIKWHEAAVEIDALAEGSCGKEIHQLLRPFILREPAPTDLKDARIAALEAKVAVLSAAVDTRRCTCHPDEAPIPCPRKFALNECRDAAVDPNLAGIMQAMVDNYKDGHQWDHLDAEVLTKAITALRSRPKRLLTEDEVRGAISRQDHSPYDTYIQRVTAEINTIL
jgi:hypothetical protein